MNEAENPLNHVLSEFDGTRANIAYKTLLSLLDATRAEEEAPTLSELRREPPIHVALLKRHPYMCNAIMQLSEWGRAIAAGRVTPDDVVVLHNLATLVLFLAESYESHGADPELVKVLDSAYRPLFEKYLRCVGSQIDLLCRFLLRIRDFLSRMALEQSRIILMEFPVGNSLPVVVLKSLITPLAEIEHIKVSLSRNDKADLGITREELLRRQLESVALRSTDIVLYLDEWNSGVNFRILCKLQSKIIDGRAFFLPCAALGHQAHLNHRYETLCKYHDAYCQVWGIPGAQLRQRFPPLVSDVNSHCDFFWAENDRIGGWRKLQLHGSMFSSIDGAISFLKANEDALIEAISLLLAEVAQTKKFPSSPQQALHAMREMFFEACQAYDSRRAEFERSADSLAAGGIVDDFESELEQLERIYREAGLVEGDTKIAVVVALSYLRRCGPIDPVDRYYFINHAPIVVALEGRLRLPHEIVMEFIRRRLEILDR